MLLKKLALCLGLFVSFFLFAAISQAQVDLDSVTEEQLTKEGPLTQQDLDLYLKFYDASASNLSKPDFDMVKFTTDFIKDNKLTTVRLRYLLEKIPMTMMALSSKADNSDKLPAYIKASPAEKKLIETNMSKIVAAMQKIQASQSK
ncbi:MAG: hypothetical protein LBT38_03335 [Deltaproteobacteria bacterium]|jgi:hypothetical protein|nr:hypothetical protein [Deltaproteobacteria bacterium]